MDIVASKAFILSLRTPRGGYTKEVLALLGISWPPPKGSIIAKYDTPIPKENFDALTKFSNTALQSRVQRSGTHERTVTFGDGDATLSDLFLRAITCDLNTAVLVLAILKVWLSSPKPIIYI
jgi:hypothetical protein